MIQVNNVELTLGTHQIFSSISFIAQSYEHIGVVGRNGAGKSTLLKLIAGDLTPDQGVISIAKNFTLAYMNQDLVLLSEKSILDETLTVFKKFLDIEQEIKDIEALLNTSINNNVGKNIELIDKYTELQDRIKIFDKNKAIAEAEDILLGLGFSKKMLCNSVNSLSVGWKMRVVLAKLLLEKADFYLFDEPTNHLDLKAQDWFFDFIKNMPAGFLLVSHDRYFLDGACDKIIEIENGSSAVYHGNFSKYILEKEKRKEIQQASYERQQKEIAKKQATINRFRASATKAKMAQSMEKQLSKINLIPPVQELPSISLRFPSIPSSGKQILVVKDLEQWFKDKCIFKNISFSITKAERVALIAANGVGKTTLFNTIVGKHKHKNGQINFGHNVQYAFFEQDQLLSLNLKNTIFEEVRESVQVADSVIRSFLGAFLFSGDDIDKPISVLSGGERNRVAMVKILLQNANFLLLDEPTNHLDLYSKDALAQALKQYPGTLLLVSHDHSFLDIVATRILELTPNEIIDFQGSYSEYKHFKQRYTLGNNDNASSNEQKRSQAHEKKEKFNKLDFRKYRKDLKKIESRVNKLEKEVAFIHQEFYKFPYGSAEYFKLADKLKACEDQLAEETQKWEKLYLFIES